MRYKIHNFIKIKILILSCCWLVSTHAAEQSTPLLGFAFKVTDNIPKQGMLYGPLDKNKLYTISCKIDNANTEQDVQITICHNGTTDDNNICSKDVKKITIKLNNSSKNSEFTFDNLQPIKLNPKWRKALKANYIIELNAEAVKPLEEDKYINGSCDIEPQKPADK